MSDSLKSFVFAGALCVVCSLLLTAAATGLKSYQLKNRITDKQTNILKSVGLIEEGRRYAAEDIEALYAGNIKTLWVTPEGETAAQDQEAPGSLPLFIYAPEGNLEAYVLPIDSNGLWGKIHGYLAIEKDGSTVKGFTVYKHQETPGLGGEIESRWFRSNFEGKKIVNPEGDFVSISIAKGKVADQVAPEQQINYVDGISGATMTGRFLSEGLGDTLRNYEPVAINFRGCLQGKKPLCEFLGN